MAVQKPSIVIVGCGISGIAAAHRLTRAGFHHVRILEATGRSGGRIQTLTLGNTLADVGASYIHGPSEENPLFLLARDFGLLDEEALNPQNQTVDCQENIAKIPCWLSSSGQKLDADLMNAVVEVFFELVENTLQFQNDKQPSWDSVGDFIRSEAQQWAAERCKDKDEATRQLLLNGISTMFKMECCSNGTHSMDELDLVGISMYESCKGLDCTIPRGFEELTRRLMSELPAGLVTYNRPVHCVHWNNSEQAVSTVTVECDDGEKIAADHVIVTVSLGYLKEHHSSLFCPPLPPHKLHSIQKLGFGTCNKIFVEFESPWWDADCDLIYLVWEDEVDFCTEESDVRDSWMKKIAAFTVVKPLERCSPILCGWIAGHEAEFMETLPEQELRRAITELFHKFTGDCTITPKRILCSRWFNDPWTRGSYSHPARGCSPQDLKNMMEPLPAESKHAQPLQVLFAGEATHPCFYSTVHGALLTGWREADRLITHHSAVQSGHLSDQKC